MVTKHRKRKALIQPVSEADLEEVEWRRLARRKLTRAWHGEKDALYDDLPARPSPDREHPVHRWAT